MAPRQHAFFATAFEQNLPLKGVARHYPAARLTPTEATVDLDDDGRMFLYPFGAVVFHQTGKERREAELARLREHYPELAIKVAREELAVVEDAEGVSGVHDEKLCIAQMTLRRASVIALTVAQSAAMEYYETIVDQLAQKTSVLVDKLQRTGTVSLRTRPLHRFIGEAIGVRSEVLSILHLLDKPDATWDDPVMDAIYVDLRDEFDLGERFDALESKLRSTQEALELVLDVARDFRLVALEASIVALIVLEIIIGFVRH